MISRSASVERCLWIAFALCFGLIVVAAFLPTRPLVGIFPAWALAVLAAAVGSLVAAVAAAFGYGWPEGGDAA